MSELMLALAQIEKEKGISREVIIEAIEKSLLDACKKDFGKTDNISVNMNRDTGDIEVFAAKTVVKEVEDPAGEISLEDALMINSKYAEGDTVNIEITPQNFGRIAAQQARSVIVQTIKEEEKKALYEHFYCKEKDVVTGVVQRYVGKNISVSLDDRMDALLMENEQIKSEHYKPTDRIKLYIVGVKETNKGPKVIVSRTHPELVKRLFEKEVSEVADGTVEIKSISREAGSRSKIAVWSNDPNVDPVGACVGMNGNRVNAIVDDLGGEKIDIITWSEDPEIFIENALSPSKVVSVRVNPEEKTAWVVVPDYQLSLAIGKEGQNARLAARLTGYKIDIKSESQAREAYHDGYYDDEYYDEYADEERYSDEYADGEGYSDEYADEEGYSDEYANEEGYADEEGYSDEYADEEGYSDEYADEDGEYADSEGYADEENDYEEDSDYEGEADAEDDGEPEE